MDGKVTKKQKFVNKKAKRILKSTNNIFINIHIFFQIYLISNFFLLLYV